jgi:hypothetical protein
MAVSLRARIVGPKFSRADLSNMWESARAPLGAPEVLLDADGDVAVVTFQPGGKDPAYERFRRSFQQAVETYWPGSRIEWLP